MKRKSITQLRRELKESSQIDVFPRGGNWIISQWSDVLGLWVETVCHPQTTEREAIERALQGESR